LISTNLKKEIVQISKIADALQESDKTLTRIDAVKIAFLRFKK
jgi:hypothetical protein